MLPEKSPDDKQAVLADLKHVIDNALLHGDDRTIHDV